MFYRIRGSEEDREKVFHKHLRPFEEPFWAQEDRQVRFKKPRLEFFLANYLSAQTAHETNIGKLFSEYKRFVERSSYPSVLDELEDLGKFRPLYMQLVKQDSAGYLSAFGNRHFQSQEFWEEDAIIGRSQQMFMFARTLWPRPERVA